MFLSYGDETFQVKRILDPIPRDKEGKIKIKDFINLDIHSEDAFDVRIF